MRDTAQLIQPQEFAPGNTKNTMAKQESRWRVTLQKEGGKEKCFHNVRHCSGLKYGIAKVLPGSHSQSPLKGNPAKLGLRFQERRSTITALLHTAHLPLGWVCIPITVQSQELTNGSA